MMKKKHFEAIAAALARTKPGPEDYTSLQALEQWEQDVVTVADALERQNPAFDAMRFYTACGRTKTYRLLDDVRNALASYHSIDVEGSEAMSLRDLKEIGDWDIVDDKGNNVEL